MSQDGVYGDDHSRRRPTALRPGPDEQGRAEVVAATVRELLGELSPHAGVRVTLDSVLDRDLGLDSLALVELIARLETALGMPLKEES
ncbi:MAG TPA: acyl carrier protein, partial [Actinomycetota bacterium]|nr:acyl carrier protein [Actinomycetota bacterium]